jgi:F0F1-type ATP synthase assembly protein I
MAPRETPKQSSDAALEFGRFAGLGLRFVVIVVLFGLLGWWIDGRFGTSPWLLVVGIVAGSALAFFSILRAVPPARNLHLPPLPLEDDRDRDERDPGDPERGDRES